MRQIKPADGSKEKGAEKSAISSKEPLAEGNVTRRKMLFATLAGGLSTLSAVVLGSAKCEGPYRLQGVPKKDAGVEDAGPDSGDASQLDAEIKDVDVPPDVRQPDAKVDASTHDSGIDSSVHDAGPDTSVPDSAVDSGVDSAVDAGNTCPLGTNEQKPAWVLSLGNPGIIGIEYSLEYAAYVDPAHVEIDVGCVSSGSPIVSAHQLTLNQQEVIPLDGKNLRITLTLFNSSNARFDAAIEDP